MLGLCLHVGMGFGSMSGLCGNLHELAWSTMHFVRKAQHKGCIILS